MDPYIEIDDELISFLMSEEYEPTLDDFITDLDDTDLDIYGAVGGIESISLAGRIATPDTPLLQKNVEADDSEVCNIVKFLKECDDRNKVPKNDPKYALIARDAEYIVKELFSYLSPRFNAKILPSGSFYEDLKVESPDEFDFMAQIESLSSHGTLDLVPSDRAGFVHVTLLKPAAISLWKDCMSFVCEHQNRREECRSCPGIADTLDDLQDWSQEVERKGTVVLAPEKIQKAFRKEINRAMNKVRLPSGWQHGGYKSPKYSGHRRHGPATLFQFVYKYKKVEYKLTLDITLCIGLPLPFSASKLNFNAYDRMHKKNPLHTILINSLKTGPGMHLIPLYSKLHTRTGYFGHKNSWRISSSLVEREILNRFSANDADHIPRRCIRLLKWLRDTYLAEEKQSTVKSEQKKGKADERKSKNKTAEHQKFKKSGDIVRTESSADEPSSDHRRSDTPVLDPSSTTSQKWLQNFYKIFPQPPDEESIETTSTTTSAATEETKYPEDDLEFYKDPGIIQYQFEILEVDSMSPSVASNEYYGAKNYVSSIEIKTFILYMIEKCPSPEGWSESMIPDIVIAVLLRLKQMYMEVKYLKNFFFDVPVCSPLPANRRHVAIEKLNKLIQMLTEGEWKHLIQDGQEMWKSHDFKVKSS